MTLQRMRQKNFFLIQKWSIINILHFVLVSVTSGYLILFFIYRHSWQNSSLVLGDPRRPYPLDIEMRCGALGQLSLKGPTTATADGSSTTTAANNKTDMSDDKKTDDLTNGKHSLGKLVYKSNHLNYSYPMV